MTSGQKIAFSLLAALALFAVFVMSLHSTIFKELETRFYAQAKIEENTGQLDKISESCDSYISEILTLVEKGDNAWTKNASVRSYYVQNPSESDVNIRRRLTENLFAEIPALKGIRIVDKNGRNVHYSSFDDTDLLKQSGISKVYKNYNDIIKDADEIPFETLQKITSETKSVLLCDENRGRVILSVPFCWVDGIYSGVALFYLNLNEVEKELIRREAISIGQGITLYADDDYNGGFILNIPHGKKADFKTSVLSYWKSRSEVMSRGQDVIQQPEKLLAIPDGRFYLALSSNRIGKIRVSSVYTSDIFELSAEIRILIYICIFISILLIVFLIFSFIRDPMVTLQKRIKKIQLEVIENYLDGKEKREWGDVARHLRQRRNDLSDEIIKSLHVHNKKRRKKLSEYLEKNWEEIFAIFETKAGVESSASSSAASSANVSGAAELTGASIAEIRRMLEEVLQNRNIVAPVAAGVAAGASAAAVKAVKTVKNPEPVEDLDDAEELDEVEELAEDVDEIDEVEELAEDVDELDDAEELDEAEEVEEVEDLAEESESDEVEALDDAEEIDELDEVEELAEEAEDVVEDLDDAEEGSDEAVEDLADEVEDLNEEVEDLDDAESEETLDGAEDEVVEDLDEEVETLEGDEEIDELADAEDDEELDVLEEYVEPQHNKDDDIDAFLKSIVAPKLEYKPSNDTYFASEKFACVDNLFAEELKLGDFRPYFVKSEHPVEIKFYPLPDYNFEPKVESEPETELEEPVLKEPLPQVEESVPETAPEVEVLTDEVPSYLPEPDFSMISFGENLSQDVPELEGALSVPMGPADAIVEKDGVFSISENLDCTDVVQDQDFKNLVDSILQ